MAPLVLHSCCLVHVCFIEQSRSGVKGRQTECNDVELLHARHVFWFFKDDIFACILLESIAGKVFACVFSRLRGKSANSLAKFPSEKRRNFD